MESNKPKLSAREQEIVAIVWQCFKAEPQVDTDKLAELGGFKNSKSASTTWGMLKKKLMTHGGSDIKDTPPKSTGKRKNGDASFGETPGKKPRGKAAKKAKAPTIESDDDDNAAE
ncbi:hypothetical protein BKA67DRAFT_658799 [Truncatella angustata]|uniref:Uncharacterized protein n=1 Tax=Truncatella angustata TaxID=152316 RepID=A0A9P8ULS2_9PEZI|nr:uncharacterized protein BKA67DRAFT_658799 [Truncatella angustata]KAH6654506.1 hypothetical protein BKA67DRAFT_658799 [Truncatella angustata]KAH8204597.1 hypothetical protein TruAng_001226 [Truncatella angustata]